MKNCLKYMLGALLGAAGAALPVALSHVLIRNLAGIFGWIGSIASMEEETIAYGVQILSQLKTAVISSPWIPFLAAGAALGLLIVWILGCRKTKRVVMNLTLDLLLLTLLAVWFTTVNDIGVGSLLRSVLPMLIKLL